MTNDQEKEAQLRASRQRAATRNPTQVVSGAYLQKPTRNIQGPLLSRSLGWRCRMTNDQKKSCSFVPPSSTEPRGTRPRWFQVHIYKKPDPEHSGPYIFQGRWGGVAGWQTARIDKGAVLCVPAALSHKEPDPGGFKCISRITDPESHAERKLLLLVKMTPPLKIRSRSRLNLFDLI